MGKQKVPRGDYWYERIKNFPSQQKPEFRVDDLPKSGPPAPPAPEALPTCPLCGR